MQSHESFETFNGRRRIELLLAFGLAALLTLEFVVATQLTRYGVPSGVGDAIAQDPLRSPIGLLFRDLAAWGWEGLVVNWRGLDHNHDAVIASATIALFVVTAVLAFFTYRLWAATLKLALDAKDTSRHELRPYVGLEELTFEADSAQSPNYVSLSQPSVLKLTIKNFGKTPAYSVRLHTLIIYSGRTPNFRPTFDPPVFMGQVVYPEHTQEFAFDPGQFPLLTQSRVGFLVYGKIAYFDPVSHVDWAFEFCREYKGNNRFVPFGLYNDESGIGSAP